MSKMDELISCPLLNREIDKDYCYDVNLVTNNFAKPEFLFDNIGDREKAKEICDSCKNSQWK